MSANATRQRKTPAPGSTVDSDGVDHSHNQPQGKAVKRSPMSQFTGQLVLAAIAFSAFYIWRLSLQSAEVGGWWNLVTGQKAVATPIADVKASASASSLVSGAQPTGHTGAGDTVEAQILKLAGSLGVKPRQLTEAIAPLLSPALVSATDSAIHSDLSEADELAAVEEKHADEHHGGVTGAVAGVVGGVGSLVDALAD